MVPSFRLKKKSPPACIHIRLPGPTRHKRIKKCHHTFWQEHAWRESHQSMPATHICITAGYASKSYSSGHRNRKNLIGAVPCGPTHTLHILNQRCRAASFVALVWNVDRTPVVKTTGNKSIIWLKIILLVHLAQQSHCHPHKWRYAVSYKVSNITHNTGTNVMHSVALRCYRHHNHSAHSNK
jgi:hypothetical protein